MNARELRRESMRIGGEAVHRDRVIDVFNPYTEQLIGTVPISCSVYGLKTSITRSRWTSPPPIRIASRRSSLAFMPSLPKSCGRRSRRRR